MGNRLTNEPLCSYGEANRLYVSLLDDYDLLFAKAADYQRLRMISRQYQASRREFQKLTSFHVIQKWINEHQLEIFNVPCVYLDSSRKPESFLDAKFRDLHIDDEIDFKFDYGHSDEESVEGEGWTGELIVRLPTGPHWDITSLRVGLASMGVYVSYERFERVEGSRVFELTVHLLCRDFKIRRFNEDAWRDLAKDDEDGLDEGEYEAQLAEEGYLDDEIDFGRSIDDYRG